MTNKGINLIDVTKDNYEDICFLNPGAEGKHFVASNSFSIAQSVYEEGWIIKGITYDDELIGFTMYGFAPELNGYEMCRFMIDEDYQGKGYGQQALAYIVNEMVTKFGCDKVYLSTSPKNNRGKHVYTKAGFVPTGELCGEGEDAEDVYVLKINK